MIRKVLSFLPFLAVAGLALFWWLTVPGRIDSARLGGLAGDPARGEQVFWAAGCASCHAAPESQGEARMVLAGGMAFPSPFGTFYAPNISPDPDRGIGGWTVADLANAMLHGTSPEGAHYYPAFPYTSYARAELQDIADLHAFLATLPASETTSRAHDVSFPFNIRRSLGGWKLLFSRPAWVTEATSPEITRGRYLVEALGHCGECHTPRNTLGGLDYTRWLQGAPTADGKGRTPAITPDKLDWSANDIAAYLATGFTPEYDVAGGHMTEVVQNLAHLPETDLKAIAAYLKTLPGGG
ncbi:cytochrome c [Marimonas arenosa]|uniref:C-type cytochrome n=1 Tax=Marimonas arenosa TaxID=1795305 RepID=A0AAE4B3V3_9RHOB|nr:cytochrome c [Marimonas arenosa]MDQ2088774.1 c-type cytochrome [Marimonas arenosa]